jgi:hypothetical protein
MEGHLGSPYLVIWVLAFKPSALILTHQFPWKRLETHHHIDLVGASFNVGHNPFAQPTLKPWVIVKNRSRLRLLKCDWMVDCLHLLHILHKWFLLPFFCRTPYLSFLCNCVILYIWFLKNVTNMPKIQLVVWILKLTSTTSIAKFKGACS